MSTVLGEVRRFPWVTLSLEAEQGTRSVDFLIDTGLDGEIALPWSYALFLGSPTKSRSVQYANGQMERTGVIDCQLYWGETVITVAAIFINGANPLLGIELLQNNRITIDMQDGGEVSIEEI